MFLFRVRRSILSTLLALAVLPFASASSAAQTGTITGRVTDAGNGQPIENAQVQAQLAGGPSYGAITGADGQFRVVNLPDGSYTVTVRKLGYDPRTFADQRPGTTLTVTLTERPTQLNQTVVTASRTVPEKQLDAPAMISVVTSERIAERPAITVADHLRSTPGVDVSKGGLAQSNIVSRGFNNAFSGSMLMLQDYRFAGVPSLRVNVPFLFTGTNEDIDRIEVLLGPASALYGPNSSNGVLHIITKSPFNSQGTTISVDGGERSVLRTGLRHSGKVNDRFAYKLSGEYFQGRDWEYKDLSEPALFPTTTNVPAGRRGAVNQRDFDLERYTGEARIDVRPTQNTEAITTVGYTKIGNGLELTGFGTSQIRNWSYANVQQRFRWNRLFLQAFLNSSNAGNDTSTSTDGTVYLRSGESIVDKSRVAALQAQHGFDMGTKQSFTYGADYIWTNPRTGNTINGRNEDVDNVTEYGAYIQSTSRPIPQLELLLAARADANNVIEGQFFSPRAAIIIKPSENQNIRFTYNRAFSTPANFSFFLDLLSSPNIGGSGFDLRARGNPPKTGFSFRRDCTSGATGSLCMKSPYAGQGDFVGASAAAALPGFFSGRRAALTGAITPGITGALQQAGLPAAQAQALAATLAAGAINRLATSAPSGTAIATRISYLTAPTVPVTEVADIKPLTASYNNTYEVGYKGIVNDRFRFDVAFWGQERGDVGIPAALATPSVFFGNPQQLGGFIGSEIGQYLVPELMRSGFTQAQATAFAAQVAPALAAGLTPTVAAAPLGVVTFNDPNTSPTALYATYQSSGKKIWVRGVDLAADVVATDRLTFELAYSYQDRTLFPGVSPAGAAPFVSNSPGSRGSLGGRYRNEGNGLGFELRARYNEAYAVNSTVYGTNIASPIAAGNPGAGTAATGGFGRCNPVPAGNFCYENVEEAFLFDAQVSKSFTIGAQQLNWSLNATNLFDNRVRTFAAVPAIGRLVLTRLQYTF